MPVNRISTRWGLLTTLVALCLSFAAMGNPPPAEGTKKVTLVVLNKAEATASLIDPRTGKTRKTLEVGVGPHEAAASPDGRTVIVCNYGDREAPGSTLSVIDMVAEEVTATVDLAPYHRPHGVCFLPGGRSLVVTAEFEQRLLVVDLETRAVTAAIETDQAISHMVALSTDAKRAFVANIGSGSVSVVDLEKKALLEKIPTGRGAEGIATHPIRSEVWVTNRAADTVSILDQESLEIVATLPCPSFPIRVAFTPDGARALVSCAKSGDVAIFDVAKRQESTRIAMEEKSVEGDEQGKRLFGDRFGDSPVPIGILMEPGGARAYIANTNADIVTVLDLEQDKVERRLTAGKEPDGLAWSVIDAPDRDAPREPSSEHGRDR